MGCCDSKVDDPQTAAEKALANEQAAVAASATAEAAKPGAHTVYCRMLDGEAIPLSCEPSTTVGELKLKIHGTALWKPSAVDVTVAGSTQEPASARKGLPPDEQTLVLDGNACADGAQTLSALARTFDMDMETFASTHTIHIAMMGPEDAAALRAAKLKARVDAIEAQRRAEEEARRKARADAEAARRAEASRGGDSGGGG